MSFEATLLVLWIHSNKVSFFLHRDVNLRMRQQTIDTHLRKGRCWQRMRVWNICHQTAKSIKHGLKRTHHSEALA